MKQHYTTLGLKEGASQEAIKAAYTKLSKDLNPANNDNQEFFKEEFEKVQAAYKALYSSSILGTEKGVESLKKIQPKSGEEKPEADKNIPKSSKKNKIKKIMKRVFLIISILIALGIAVFTWWSFQTKLNNLVYSQSETKWAKNDISNDIVYLKKTMIPFNGTLTKYKTNYSGKFVNGKKTNWWVFYDPTGQISHKCQLKFNQKNGYCLKYKNGDIISASKYNAGKKIKEWYNLKDFKKENNLLNLR